MTDQEKSEQDTDIEAWLAELGGHSTESSNEAQSQAAQRIREIVLHRQKSAEDAIADVRLEHGRDQLMFRLARERLLPKKFALGTLMRQPMAMAASVAVAFVAVALVTSNLQQGQPVGGDTIIWSGGELDIMRGEVPTVQVSTDDPVAAARALAGRLEDSGIPFELHGDVDAQIRSLRVQIAGQNLPDDIAKELRILGVSVDTLQIVDIKFVTHD